MSGVIGVDVLASLTLLAVCADIRRLIQFGTALRYICIADLIADMVRTVLASVEIASMHGSIFADAVAKAPELVYAVVFAFGSESISKSAMIPYFTGDRGS